jgi:hypothetical protein
MTRSPAIGLFIVSVGFLCSPSWASGHADDLATIQSLDPTAGGATPSAPFAGYFEGWETSSGSCTPAASCYISGWRSNTINTNIEVVDAGGNPGRYLRSFGISHGLLGALSEFGELTGDYRGATWRFSTDLLFSSGTVTQAWLRFRYMDPRYNGWRYPLTYDFTPGVWHSVSVDFNPHWTDDEARAAGWITDHDWSPSANPSEPFTVTMSDVYTIEIRLTGWGPPEAGIDNVMLEAAPLITPIVIDIKPGSDPNSINPRSQGLIPVAILGSESFDVTAVDQWTLRFGPLEASIAHRSAHLEDVNLDGHDDLVAHFSTWLSGLECGQTEATLIGETLDGDPIEASDSIRTVGCHVDPPPRLWDRSRRPREDDPGSKTVEIERQR